MKDSYLVAKTLGGDDGDFIADALVGLEVEGEFGVVAFDDDFGRLFDGLEESQSVRRKPCQAGGFLHHARLTFVRTRPILSVCAERERARVQLQWNPIWPKQLFLVWRNPKLIGA